MYGDYICDNCGRKRYNGEGKVTDGHFVFCCEGCRRIFMAEENARQQEEERRWQEEQQRQEMKEYLRKLQMKTEYTERLKCIKQLDAKALGIPLNEAVGNSGDWNGVKIHGKRSFKVADGKVTIKIGELENTCETGATGTLRVTLEYKHPDGSKEIAAKCYFKNLMPEMKRGNSITINETVDYTKPKNKTRESIPMFCVYELNGEGKWVRLLHDDFYSDAEEERKAEKQKEREAQLERQKKLDKKRSKQLDFINVVRSPTALVVASMPLWFTAICTAGGDHLTVKSIIFFAVYTVVAYQIAQIWCFWPLALHLATILLLIFIDMWDNSLDYKSIVAVVVGLPLLIAGFRMYKCEKSKYYNTERLYKASIKAVVLFVLPIVLCMAFIPMTGRGVFAKKAASNMAKWYTPETDVIVGQQYVLAQPSVYKNTGEIVQEEATAFFGKNGLADGKYLYSVDTKKHRVSVIRENRFFGLEKKIDEYSYFADGTVVFKSAKKRKTILGGTIISSVRQKERKSLVKADPTFNAENAREVIGKTFSGDWSDQYTASVTFDRDGTATVKFSDGDTAKGAYLADAELNTVFYNHRNAGVWYIFEYSPDYVIFKSLEEEHYDWKMTQGR